MLSANKNRICRPSTMNAQKTFEQTLKYEEARKWLALEGRSFINEYWKNIRLDYSVFTEDEIDAEGQPMERVFERFTLCCHYGHGASGLYEGLRGRHEIGKISFDASDIEEIKFAGWGDISGPLWSVNKSFITVLLAAGAIEFVQSKFGEFNFSLPIHCAKQNRISRSLYEKRRKVEKED